MVNYNNDYRTNDSRVQTIFYKGEKVRETTSTLRKCQGVLHTFSGASGGKFIPGEVRINPMTATRTTTSLGHGEWYCESSSNSKTVVSELVCGNVAWRGGISSAGSDYDSALVGAAVQRAHAALIDAAWDGGEFLAELPETIAMVRTGVGGLLKAARYAAKHNGFTWNKADRARLQLLRGRSIKTLPKKLANAWLTWRYGIRPIIWDVQEIIKEANNIALRSNFAGLQRRRGRAADTKSESFQYTADTGWANLKGDCKEYVEYERKVEAVVYFKYGSSWGPYNDILQRYGLHPNQFPSLLWQLRPLTFMLDWFVDVNTWVKAITPKWGMKIMGCSCSQKTILRATRISTPTGPSTYSIGGSPLNDTNVIERIVRRPQTLQGEFPRLRPNIILSIQKQADILSVFLQRALHDRRH